jgi:hypothetical protein
VALGAEAFPEESDNLILQSTTALGPVPGSREVLNATPQPAKMEDVWSQAKLLPKRVPQKREEKELASMSRFAGQATQVAFGHGRSGTGIRWQGWTGLKTTEHFFQSLCKLSGGHNLPAQLVFKIMKHGFGGLADEFIIKPMGGFPCEFHRKHVSGERDGFATA